MFESNTRTSLVAQMVKHLPAMQKTWVRSLGQEDPLEKFHGWKSLVGYSPWGRKESGTTEQLRFLSFFLRVTKFLLTLK